MNHRKERTYCDMIKLHRREDLTDIFQKTQRQGKYPQSTKKFFWNGRLSKNLPRNATGFHSRDRLNDQNSKTIDVKYPESCVGAVVAKFKDGRVRWGSGVLIEGYNIMTSASVLRDDQLSERARSAYFFPIYSQTCFERIRFHEYYFHSPSPQQNQPNCPQLAVSDLRCDNKSNSLGYIPVIFDYIILPNSDLEIMGHRELGDSIEFFQQPASFVGCQNSQLTYKMKKQSVRVLPGSGVYVRSGEALSLIGLHTAQHDGVGTAELLTDSSRCSINGWLRKEIITIDIAGRKVTDEELRTLAHYHNKDVHVLSLQNSGLTSDELQVLSQTQWPQLERLMIGKNGFEVRGLEVLLRRDWSQLITLNLNQCGLEDIGVRKLAQSSWKNLTTLIISNNRITSQGLKDLLSSNPWPSLNELFLTSNQIDNQGAYYLSKYYIPSLTRLMLDWNYIGDLGVQMLCCGMKQLEYLSLYNNDVQIMGVCKLKAGRLRNLKRDNLKRLWNIIRKRE